MKKIKVAYYSCKEGLCFVPLEIEFNWHLGYIGLGHRKLLVLGNKMNSHRFDLKDIK